MLINLRNALMAGKRLPYDAEVEYLESDGSQFIKVPGKISSTSRITVTFKYTGATFSQFAPFGGGDGNMLREASLISDVTPTGKWIYRCNNRQNLNVVNLDNSQIHTVTWYKDGAVLDGVDYPSLTTASDFTPTRDYFGLFANLRNGDNSPLFTMRGYIMSAQVYDNGVLVRDYIPVRKGTVGYLYDRVSGKLFGNAGTGDFVLGPDVVPVEYIESHAAEYIDTGVYGSQNLRTTFDYQLVYSGTAPVAKGLFGCYTSGMKYHLYCSGVAPSCFQVGMGNDYINTIRVDNVRHSIEFNNSAVSIDGNVVATFEPYGYPTAFTLLLFALRNSSVGLYSMTPMRKWRVQMWDNGTPVRDYVPVRIGSGSTWEGAMMDVLTRRIYRNAGTGAFTFGNDLKYPIPAE